MSTFEHALYIGIGLGCVLLGLDIAIYCATIRNLYYSKSLSTRSGMLIGILSTSSLILLCINVATNAIFGEQAWITFRDTLPGGPPAWIVGNFDVWYQTLSTTCVAALIFSSDAFLVRTHLFSIKHSWHNSPRFIASISFVDPVCFSSYSLSLCGLRVSVCSIFSFTNSISSKNNISTALAILEIYVSAVPGGYFFSRASINFGLPYYTISIALNVILTCGIVGRVVYFSRLLRPTLSSASLQVYTGVTAILIESAALYTVVGFMTIIPYGLNAPTSVAFGQVWTKFAVRNLTHTSIYLLTIDPRPSHPSSLRWGYLLDRRGRKTLFHVQRADWSSIVYSRFRILEPRLQGTQPQTPASKLLALFQAKSGLSRERRSRANLLSTSGPLNDSLGSDVLFLVV